MVFFASTKQISCVFFFVKKTLPWCVNVCWHQSPKPSKFQTLMNYVPGIDFQKNTLVLVESIMPLYLFNARCFGLLLLPTLNRRERPPGRPSSSSGRWRCPTASLLPRPSLRCTANCGWKSSGQGACPLAGMWLELCPFQKKCLRCQIRLHLIFPYYPSKKYPFEQFLKTLPLRSFQSLSLQYWRFAVCIC